MTSIQPFLLMVTIQNVEYEDAMVPTGISAGDAMLLATLSGEMVPLVEPQGISAGIVIDTGSLVNETLKPGFKVYYLTNYARKIADVIVVDMRCVIAYEELG